MRSSSMGMTLLVGSELYVGPELIALGHRNFTEYRLGVHLTEIKLGKVNVGLSGGALWNDDLGRGGYGTVYMTLKF